MAERTLVHVRCDPTEGDSFLAWKIARVAYGSEGTRPRHLQACPFFLATGRAGACVSGSGDSMCGGFMGGTPGYVYCIWGTMFTTEDLLSSKEGESQHGGPDHGPTD